MTNRKQYYIGRDLKWKPLIPNLQNDCRIESLKNFKDRVFKHVRSVQNPLLCKNIHNTQKFVKGNFHCIYISYSLFTFNLLIRFCSGCIKNINAKSRVYLYWSVSGYTPPVLQFIYLCIYYTIFCLWYSCANGKTTTTKYLFN